MKLVILDRDGVINEDSDEYIKSRAEWIPIPDSLKAISSLNAAGYRVVVATNQSGIARGMFDVDTLHAMNRKMASLLRRFGGSIDGVFFCPHGPEDRCDCRKPLPGLYRQISRRYQISLKGVPAVGDSARDLVAAQAAGASPVLVRTGKGERTLAAGDVPDEVPVYNDLAEFAESLLSAHRPS